MNCCNCGKSIKHPYHFDGKIYGIECWKQIALPQIEAKRQARYAEIKQEQYIYAKCHIEVLNLKDWSKITSRFKQSFSTSVIEQFETKGWLSNKQCDIISQFFNNKDWKNYWRIAVEAGLNNKQELIHSGMMKESDFE